MKITFFIENHYKGGLDTFLISLVNNWPHPEDIITIICNHDHPGISSYRQRIRRDVFIHVHHIPNHTGLHRSVKRKGTLGFLIKLIVFAFQYLLFVLGIYALRKLLLTNNPDRLVIVNGGYPGGSLCRAAAISWGYFAKGDSIHNFHNFVVPYRKFSGIIEYFIDHFVCRYTKAFVTVSDACARSMKGRSILKKYNVRVILNGIDTTNHACSSTNKESDLHKELGIPRDSKICLMLGTYEARKGHDFLLKAFKRVVDALPCAHLVICGYGTPNEVERVRVARDCLGLRANVHLLGFREDVPWLLKQTDVLAVPSQEYESFGLMIVEAMAFKVPVVATRVGGIPEVLRDGEGGYCVDSSDVEGFAKYLILFMQDERLREEQGTIGFSRYQTLFTARRMAQEYASLIRS
jgi:glycosyltransferase involved in cell wall biosynthesis